IRNQNKGNRRGTSRERFKIEEPVYYETEVAVRIPAAVGKNTETPVKWLTSNSYETEVMRKNYISMKHPHVKEPRIVYCVRSGQYCSTEPVAERKAGVYYGVTSTQQLRS